MHSMMHAAALTYCHAHYQIPPQRTAEESPPIADAIMATSQSKQKSSLGCIGLLFGCGVRSKSNDPGTPTKHVTKIDGSSPITVEDDDGNKKSSAGQEAPPSPDNTEATEDSSLDGDMPDMDDPATNTSTNYASIFRGSVFQGSVFRGSSAMERNIARVLYSFLITLLTLGLAGRSSASREKALAYGSESKPSATTENAGTTAAGNADTTKEEE